MSSLSAKDRVSLCMFSFSDGRRCRTPRARNHPHFCFYHAEKEAKARAAENLAQDLAYFFSGTYLSACDLSAALGCLIPAVIRGDVKPKTARTVAYMAQTLLQAIHLSKHEYINAFGTDAWRESIRNSVNGNHNYRFPSASEPEQSESSPTPTTSPNAPASEPVAHPFRGEGSSSALQPQAASPPPQSQPPVGSPSGCHSDTVAQTGLYPACPEHLGDRVGRPEEPASSSNSSPATHHSFTQSAADGPLPQPLPRTSAEFAQQVLASLQANENGEARRNSSRSASLSTSASSRGTGEKASIS